MERARGDGCSEPGLGVSRTSVIDRMRCKDRRLAFIECSLMTNRELVSGSMYFWLHCS